MLPIVQAPNSVLSETAKEVQKIDGKILHLISEMKETLLATRDPEGVGLAAPQVGYSLRIFIIKPTKKASFHVFVNPVLKEIEPPSQTLPKKAPKRLEGCLSLGNIWGAVTRKQEVRISYWDEHGKTHEKIFRKFSATIVQHEMDHLNGTLFPKRVLEQKGKLYKSRKNAKNENVFDEIEI